MGESLHVATSREYVTHTGVYKGVPISCTSTGIGAPSTSAGTFLESVHVGDMATRVWGLRAGGMAVVLDNVRRVSGDCGEFLPENQIEHGTEQVERLARLGCETVRQRALQDRKAPAAPPSEA